MNALRALLSLEDPFRGAGALLAAKRRGLASLFVLNAVIGLGFGLFLTLLVGLDPTDALRGLWLTTGLVALTFLPPVFCGYVTFSSSLAQAGGRCRREELLTLPIGRLAIPTMILLASAAAVIASLAGSLLGAGVTVGPEAAWQALSGGPSGGAAQVLIPIMAVVFSGSVAFTAIGNNVSLLGLGWALLPLAFGLGLDALGYGNGSVGFVFLWAVPLTLFHLLLPFVLYALPPHHWSDHQVEALQAPLVAQLLAYGVVALVVFLGWLPTLAALALSGLCLWRLTRGPQPERRAASGLRVTLGLGLVFFLPPLAVCLLVDRCVMALPVEDQQATVLETRPSPDGTRVALVVQPRPRWGGFQRLTMHRVVIVDPTGAAAPVVLPPRFARLGGWSADGRYLAVHDDTFGRMKHDHHPKRDRAVGTWNRIKRTLDVAFSRTLIYDTQQGAVTHDLPRREVAPGWREVEELIHVRPALRERRVVYRDGTGRSLALPPEQAQLAVHRYTPEGPILKLARPGHQNYHPYVAGVGPVSWGFQRWATQGLAQVETDGWRITRLLDAVEKQKARGAGAKRRARAVTKEGRRAKPRPVAYQLTRGERTVEVRDVYDLIEPSCTDDAVLAVSPAGVVRIALPSGQRTVLVAASQAKERILVTRCSGRWVALARQRTVLLDALDVALPPLEAGAHLRAVLAGNVLLTQGRHAASPMLISAGAAPRHLLPR